MRRVRVVGVAAVAVTSLVAAPAGAESATTAVTSTTAGDVTIQQIHGTTFRSPLNGKQVAGVPGVVTAVATQGKSQGFWFADPTAHDPRSSSALQVFTGSKTPDVKVGDKVLVSGTVQDYFPDAPESKSVDLPVTELSKPTWTVQSSGNATPKPLLLNEKNVPARLTAEADGGTSIEHDQLQPSRYALDFYKAHESELVSVNDARVVGPSNSYGEMWITARPKQNPTQRGGTLYSGYDQPNSGRLLLSALPGAQRTPMANVGDHLAGATTGPLSYSQFGGYQVLATKTGSRVDGGIKQETTRAESGGEMSTATYNVENLSPKDDPAKFQRLADGVVHNLSTPDVLSLEEIQDNDGPTDSGTVAADHTLKQFADAIVAAGGPRYEWREIDPANKADGGQPGGNIRVAFLYNPARVSFVDKPGGTATSNTTVGGTPGHATISASPGRIAPENGAWDDSRKPLVGEFRFAGKNVFVIGNHFDSKGGDQPLEGRYQPPARSSETQRVQQANLVNGFVRQLEQREPQAKVVVLGDMNDYQFSPALKKLTAGNALTDLIDTLPARERYSYVYQGNSQVLDHILASKGVRSRSYDVVHTNAEFADQISDHDPQVLRFKP